MVQSDGQRSSSRAAPQKIVACGLLTKKLTKTAYVARKNNRPSVHEAPQIPPSLRTLRKLRSKGSEVLHQEKLRGPDVLIPAEPFPEPFGQGPARMETSGPLNQRDLHFGTFQSPAVSRIFNGVLSFALGLCRVGGFF